MPSESCEKRIRLAARHTKKLYLVNLKMFAYIYSMLSPLYYIATVLSVNICAK